MATVYRARPEDAARIRDLLGPLVAEVCVYDADFPHVVGQQFVEAVAVGDGVDRELDLTDPANAELSEVLHAAASDVGVTVKFWLTLT